MQVRRGSREERGNEVQETAGVCRIPISYMPAFPRRTNGALLAIMAHGANWQTLAHQRQSGSYWLPAMRMECYASPASVQCV